MYYSFCCLNYYFTIYYIINFVGHTLTDCPIQSIGFKCYNYAISLVIDVCELNKSIKQLICHYFYYQSIDKLYECFYHFAHQYKLLIIFNLNSVNNKCFVITFCCQISYHKNLEVLSVSLDWLNYILIPHNFQKPLLFNVTQKSLFKLYIVYI